MTAQESILQNAYETTLALAIGADLAETSVQVNAAPVGSPSAANPMYLVIDPDSDSTREYIKVTSRSGVSLTVVRNIDSDSGGLNAHAVGAKVRMVAMKQHFDDLNDRVDTIMNSAGTAVNTSGLVKDEDTMSSNSDTHLATQQSIKAYVDNQVTAQDLDFTADTTTGTPSIDLDSETLNVAGGAGIETSASGNEITVAIDSTVVTESSTDTLTNKTIDANATGNSITNIEVADLASGVLDTDLSSVSASDDTIPSAKATKAYVDAQVDTKDTLAELDDVTITTPGEDEVLAYDNGTSKFINQTPSEAGLATSAQGALADSAVQPGDNVSDLTNDSGYITASSTDSLTNKTFNVEATGNSISNIDVADLKSGVLDTDLSTVSASDDTLPSAKATKAYTDSQVTKTVIDALNIDADTLDGNDSTAFATSAQGTLADSATQPGDNVSTLTNDAGYLTTIDLTGESIDELSDVDTSTVAPTEGQALLWDSTDGEWQPGDVASSTAAKIIDTDGDTQIQTEESADEDILRFDTAGTERATMSTTMALTSAGGAYIHSQNQTSNYTIGSTDGAVYAGPLTISGIVTNAGTMVIL